MRQAFVHLNEPWSASRIAKGRAGLEKKRVRRNVVRGTAVMSCAVAVAVLAVIRSPDVAPTERQRATAMVSAPSEELTDGALLLTDGSFAEPLTQDTALAVEADGETDVRIALLDGAARFDVIRNANRKFVVTVRGVRVEVIGTRFEVALDGARVHVRVIRGHVRVTWPRGRRDLLAQQSGLFPIDEGSLSASDAAVVEEATPAPVEVAETLRPRTQVAPRPEPAATNDWRRLAREGDYESAFRASREQTVTTSIDDLWLAADASRLSGHPREAVGYLEQAISLHPSDGRVHLAAFTLGRLHLQLGQPRQAAMDFARVERLDRRGVLIEQALAREVEAWARAGDGGRARERAGVYLRRFPSGNYAERVRRFSSPP